MKKLSYLIQRLKKPFLSDEIGLANIFSFGGGFVNGGLSKEAMGLLEDVFSFDYMGAAEYEFGDVPRALTQIYANRKNYGTVTKELGGKNVYIICNFEDSDAVVSRVALMYREKYKTRDWVGLKEALGKDKLECGDVCGWLELDNGYFFFVDKEMFEKMCKLFDIGKVVNHEV